MLTVFFLNLVYSALFLSLSICLSVSVTCKVSLCGQLKWWFNLPRKWQGSSGAGVRAGGRKAQSTCQYYLSLGNVEVLEKVLVCRAALCSNGKEVVFGALWLWVIHFISFVTLIVFCLVLITIMCSFINCRTSWARPTVLLERWLDRWAVAWKKL